MASVVDAITATLGAIVERDRDINAFTGVTNERALAQARRIQMGAIAGPLAGVPFAVKNLFDVQGFTTLAGSKINRDLPPAARDATLIMRLEAAGAVLVDADGAWLATPPPISPRSTVGAGDSSLAGYVRADVEGATAPQRLQMAVAYGSGAAALPGSALPSPAQLNLDGVTVTAVNPDPKVRS